MRERKAEDERVLKMPGKTWCRPYEKEKALRAIDEPNDQGNTQYMDKNVNPVCVVGPVESKLDLW